jgi:hypothetical protein
MVEFIGKACHFRYVTGTALIEKRMDIIDMVTGDSTGDLQCKGDGTRLFVRQREVQSVFVADEF